MNDVDEQSSGVSAAAPGLNTDAAGDAVRNWLAIAEAVDENEAMVSVLFLRERGIDAERGNCDGVLPDGGREDLPGVWIWVRGARVEDAKRILAQWQTPPGLRGCPFCGSTEIYRNKRVTIYEWVFGWFHLPTLWRLIGEGFGRRHECFRCGFRWAANRPWRAFPVISVGAADLDDRRDSAIFTSDKQWPKK